MKKIAIFGKPGSGKSTLSKALASVTGIPLYQLDSILYKNNGERVDHQTYDKAHENILSNESWIIDGFDRMASFNQRINIADTLIYIDLPYVVSYWLVTKRLIKSLVVKPEGWPEGSSVFKGSLQSYKMLKLCPTFWNEDFLLKLEEIAPNKSIYIIRSISQLNNFINENVKSL